MSVDPRKTLNSYPKDSIELLAGQDEQGVNISRDITRFPEPGYLDWKVNQFTVMRGGDPADGSKKAFRHKIMEGMSYRADASPTARAMLLSQWGVNRPAVLHDSVPYWAAFAFYVDKDHPLNGTGADLHIFNLGHAVSSHNTLAMHLLFLRKDGTLNFMIGSNNVLDGGNDTRVTTSGFRKPVETGMWHYLVFQFKYEWDVTKGPYTRVWWAKGNGTPVQVVNTNIANAYRESAGYRPWYFGIYAWDVSTGPNSIWSTSPHSTSRTLYTKGLHIFRDQPGTPTLGVNSMLALIRSM